MNKQELKIRLKDGNYWLMLMAVILISLSIIPYLNGDRTTALAIIALGISMAALGHSFALEKEVDKRIRIGED